MGGSLKWRSRRWQEPAVVGGAALVLVGAVVPPLVCVTRDLLLPASSLQLLAGAHLWALLARSVGLSGAVTLLSLATGVPLGVLFSKAAFPLKRPLLAIHVAVVFLPPFLPALGWFHVFGRDGWLEGALATRLLFGELGVILVLTGCFAPIVTALTALGVSGVDASLEEAARVAGGPWRAATWVVIPLAAPAIALGGIVVFALAFSELAVPMFLRVDVYPAVVFSRLGGMDFAPGEAAVLGLPLVGVALGLLWLERRLAGRRAIAALGHGARAGAPLFHHRLPSLLVAALAAAVSALPLAALVRHAWTGEGLSEVARWTGAAPLNGLRAGAIAAGLMTAIAIVLGVELARGRRWGTWLDGLASLSFILPSSILGVGLISAWNHPATGWLYGGFAILVVGFMARYVAIPVRIFAAVTSQVPVSLDEAARSAGAGYVARLMLAAGLARRGVGAAFVAGLVFSLRDVELAALFYPPGGEPLTVRIFTLEANGPPSVVSSLAVLHILITFCAVGLGAAALGKRAPE